jgi:hypothetical protein
MPYQDDFRLFMISAMYENGGNTTHRFLDGHPELFVYPFESQLGNSRTADTLSSLYPFKYRYPDFPASTPADVCYELFFDEELKTLARVPRVSKFRDAGLELDEPLRKRRFVEILADKEMTRGNIVAAFFESTFEAWTNVNRTGREVAYVGYSPVIGFDADRILGDFPNGHVIHVVRNPWSGYADTIKRPFPLSLERYTWLWSLLQHHALVWARRYPDRFHILRFEDLVASPRDAMGKLADELGIGWDDALLQPTWNAQVMEQVYPWGTIRTPTTEANIATMNELDAAQKAGIKEVASVMLGHFGYEDMA